MSNELGQWSAPFVLSPFALVSLRDADPLGGELSITGGRFPEVLPVGGSSTGLSSEMSFPTALWLQAPGLGSPDPFCHPSVYQMAGEAEVQQTPAPGPLLWPLFTFG